MVIFSLFQDQKLDSSDDDKSHFNEQNLTNFNDQ